jgi:hypothetical protein
VHLSITNNIFNLFPEQFELQLIKALRPLKLLGCDYFYFLGMDGENCHRFCSHEDWIDHYNKEKFSVNDPLKRLVNDTSFIALPWEQLTHLNKNEKKPMDCRISYGLFNGLTIAREYRGKKYILVLATESKEHDLARYLMLEKIEPLEQFVRDCMRLFDQYLLLMSHPVTKVV